MVAAAAGEAGAALKVRQQIGAMALATPTASEAQRRAIIALPLPHPVWPQRRLKIVAVDAESGEDRVFDKDSGVDLVDAVAASCAVPGVWPPVTIGERRYMDGGMRSATNADLAKGASRVLVLSLMDLSGLQDLLMKQIAQLEAAGAEVKVVSSEARPAPSAEPDRVDLGQRRAAAQAGRRQGRKAAAQLKGLWWGKVED